MTPKTSQFSKGSRRFASGPACTSEPPVPRDSTTWSTRWWTTALTRPCRVAATTSWSRSFRATSSRSEDNGSGIPVAVMDSVGLPAVEVVLTKLHAGGKFGGSGYKVSGGLHGVGISVVNALSDHLRVAVKRDGYVVDPALRARRPHGAAGAGRGDRRARDDDRVPPRPRDLRGDRLLVRHAGPADAGDGVPDQGPSHRADRRPRRRPARRLPVRGRHPRLHRVRQPEQGRGPPRRHLLRERDP